MNEPLSGRTALVTGSTDGIGSAVARVLAAAGAHVVVSGRNRERGEKVVAGIAEAGGSAVFVGADLAGGLPAARALADAAGPLDILVNNAGLLVVPGPTGEVTPEVIDRTLAVNVTATFLLTGLVAPAMAARGGGTIVNLGSVNGLAGAERSALYSMTKAAVHSLTQSWAAEYGPQGVRVNAVAPGPTLTETVAGMSERLAPRIARYPSRRASLPDEVAEAVLFLAGDRAANLHGVILPVDGGASAVIV